MGQGEERKLRSRFCRLSSAPTVKHIIDVPCVQILDAPVPQIVDNVMDASRRLDRPIAEQDIAVPKISCSSCPARAVFCEPRMVE